MPCRMCPYMLHALQVVKRDGSLAYSPIYLFPHFQTAGERVFVRITTESNATVRTSVYSPGRL